MPSLMRYVVFKRSRNMLTNFFVRFGVDNLMERNYDEQVSRLHLAVAHGNIRRVRFFVERGDHVNAKDSKGKSVLHYAVICDSLSIAKYLLAMGAKINARDSQGLSILHYSILSGSSKLLNMLLRHGAALEAKDDRGWSTIHIAVLSLSIKSNLFMDRRGVRLNPMDVVNLTPNRVAINEIGEMIVSVLLEHGVNINVKTQEGHCPLFYAALTGQLNTVKLLISKGADINAQTEAGDTALMAACERGHSNIAEILLNNKADINLMAGDKDVPVSWMSRDEATTQIVVKHISKLQAEMQLVNEKLLNAISINQEAQNFYEKCQSELAGMKSEKIKETCTKSYYYLFSKSLEKIASLARNEEIVKTLKFVQLSEKYPIFGEEMKIKFSMALDRKNFSAAMESYVEEVSAEANLPDAAIQNIVSYLKIEDFNA